MKQYDFLVIGSGPAGQKAAIQAAKFGKRTAVIERRTVIDDLMQRLHITLKHEIEIMQNQMARNDVEVIQGIASFKGEHRLRVKSAAGEILEVEADKILIATGTQPQRPERIPFDNTTIIDSDGIVNLKMLPKTIVIIGAGVIGVEYASIFSVLDIELTLIDGRDTLLEFLDREIVDEFIHSMRQRDITLRLGEKVTGVEKDANGRVITTLESGKRLRAELVMFAAGRLGTTTELQIDNAGIATDNKQRIPVNEQYQTVAPHIYAAGDVIGFPSLASTSMEQGRLAACHAFDQISSSRSEHFPFGIYSVPEMSMVGVTEQELTAKKIPYETGTAHLWETARGQIMGLEEGMLKMIFSTEDQRLLGVHILGEGATELIHIGQAVLVLGGTLEYFLETVFNYPTLAPAPYTVMKSC
jgi:NAD(P) transhydrogenase